MNFSLFFKRMLAALACVGVLTFATAKVLAAEHGEAPKTTASTTAKADAAHEHAHDEHAGHGHATGPEVTLLSQFGYSYLTAFMFVLSILVASMFFILIHHLFDAGWSVPVMRIAENMACLFFPWGLVALVPILILSTLGHIHPWMNIDPAGDPALNVKKILFNKGSFNVGLVLIFLFWGWMAHSFRRFSLAQDKDGAAIWTRKARFLAGWGIFAFAVTVTVVVFLLMKSLQHQFFSTMYGVYYFAGSMWVTFATYYGIMRWLEKRELKPVVSKITIHAMGLLFFAFTVFYAYIHFSQYFLIWNAAMPEETFWYVLREQGSWWGVGMIILFGHFFLPFLLLLRIDTKMTMTVMGPMIVWAWLMHYLDMTYNVMPVLYPDGLHITLWDPICWGGLAAAFGVLWWKSYKSFPAWPQKHPRLKEAITHHEVPRSAAEAAAAHH
jgi:hypothetical protein